MRKTMTAATLLTMLVCAGPAIAAPTASQKCEARKNGVAADYAACIASALNGFVANADAGKYAIARGKCEDKFATTWDKLEAAALKADSQCSSTGDKGTIEGYVDPHGAARTP